MELRSVTELFRPLEPEQGLHLLDVMTWFPESGGSKWEKVSEYVAKNASVGEPPSPELCQQVCERILATGPGVDGSADGRWRDIPQAKWLYQVKYDLMSLLYPDDWFTYMNMGFAERDFVLDESLPPERRIWEFAANLYTKVATQIDLTGLDVLEVGSGRGGGAALVAAAFGPKSLVGLDYSPNNVAFCRRVHEGPGLSFQQGDAEQLPFDDNSFDAVLNVESAHCYPHVDAFFAEVGRVLKPGGHLLFADEWWAGQEDQLRAQLTGAGLTLVSEEDMTAGIIRALRFLENKADDLLNAMPDGPRKDAYSRFFHKRVCQQSAYSYTSGRFVFLRALARAGDR